MSWAPVQQRHAIERVRFDIAFAEQIPQRVIDAVQRKFEERREQLRFGPVQPAEFHQVSFQVGTPAPSVLQKAGGWKSVRNASTGSVEALIVNQTGLAYESTDYRTWEMALRRFMSVAEFGVEQFAAVVDFRALALDYTDRFVFQGVPVEASPEEILDRALLASVSEGARKGLYTWHVHRGWFDRLDGRTILMNQNVDAVDGKTHTGSDVRSIQIYTRAEFRPEPNQFVTSDLEAIFDQLHTLCNEHFSSIISESARSMVGMRSNGSGTHA